MAYAPTPGPGESEGWRCGVVEAAGLSLDPTTFEAIYDQKELDEIIRIHLRMEFATTETEVHEDDLAGGAVPFAQELLGSITKKVIITPGGRPLWTDEFISLAKTWARLAEITKFGASVFERYASEPHSSVDHFELHAGETILFS